MRKAINIGIWGQFGDGKNIADGQAVKTLILYRELQNHYGESAVSIVNTNGWRRHPIAMLYKSFMLVAHSEKVLILPADNGFKIFMPILYNINRIFHRDLIYIVIGGFLPMLLKSKTKYIGYLNQCRAIFAETKTLTNDISIQGVKNVFTLPNFKRLNAREKGDLGIDDNEKIRLCVFSRVTREKGIEDAMQAVRLANEKLKKQVITLDIYGLLPDSYKDEFLTLINQYAQYVSYKGIVSFDKTVDTLKQYFAMLFPTYYHGEGFPGNIIDAYNTGIPVIATDWQYNRDILQEGRNGLLVEPKNPFLLSEAILKLYHDRNLAYQIAMNNLEDAKRYNPDVVLLKLYTFLDGQNNDCLEQNREGNS